MEDVKKPTEATQPVAEAPKEEKTFTQEEVNALMGKTRDAGRAAVLKELGVENIEDTKEAIKLAKEHQDAQKTELEKALEEASNYKTLYEEKSTKIKSIELNGQIKNILNDLEVDGSKARLIKKLINTSEMYDGDTLKVEDLKSSITNVIEEELPELKIKKPEKVGAEKTAKEMKSPRNEYLKNKYKNNPYFRG